MTQLVNIMYSDKSVQQIIPEKLMATYLPLPSEPSDLQHLAVLTCQLSRNFIGTY